MHSCSIHMHLCLLLESSSAKPRPAIILLIITKPYTLVYPSPRQFLPPLQLLRPFPGPRNLGRFPGKIQTFATSFRCYDAEKDESHLPKTKPHGGLLTMVCAAGKTLPVFCSFAMVQNLSSSGLEALPLSSSSSCTQNITTTTTASTTT